MDKTLNTELLWAIHTVGPDEYTPVNDYLDGFTTAAKLNDLADRTNAGKEPQMQVLCAHEVVLWPFDAEAHARVLDEIRADAPDYK